MDREKGDLKMGWDFGVGESRKDMTAHLVKTFVNHDGMVHICIAHKNVGNSILWAVWNEEGKDPYIVCYLTKRVNYGSKRDPVWSWGYKAMSESVDPYYYSCPLEFLTLAPVTCPAWRDKVKIYHEKRKRKVEKGQAIKLEGSTIPRVRITSTRPLLGVYLGKVYRIPRRMLGREIAGRF